MQQTAPPGTRPAAARAGGGGSCAHRHTGALANHWKRWDAKPEAVAQRDLQGLFDAMLVRLRLANRRKRRDGKA